MTGRRQSGRILSLPLNVRVGQDGAALPNARVFLGGVTPGGARWAQTNEDGVFTFERLPTKYSSVGVRVMVMGTLDEAGWMPAHKDDVTVPTPGFELRVVRTCMLRLNLTGWPRRG